MAFGSNRCILPTAERLASQTMITDIRMPVMDGLEMLKLIHSLNPAVSTVVLSCHAVRYMEEHYPNT